LMGQMYICLLLICLGAWLSVKAKNPLMSGILIRSVGRDQTQFPGLAGFAAIKWIVGICLNRVRAVCHPISPAIVDLRISGLQIMD
ncbi:MAG: hypothetical protein WBF08_02355, partial [Candidatus Bathyarchaeia archaeon]